MISPSQNPWINRICKYLSFFFSYKVITDAKGWHWNIWGWGVEGEFSLPYETRTFCIIKKFQYKQVIIQYICQDSYCLVLRIRISVLEHWLSINGIFRSWYLDSLMTACCQCGSSWKLEKVLQESLLLMQYNRAFFSLSCHPSLGLAYNLRTKLPWYEHTFNIWIFGFTPNSDATSLFILTSLV